ncbi:hypothetical protein QA601_12760 [Chitinispirillales bacterium ANBcel5]|uniref:hypothetical protein n=1 Tax=Cellulosispirillum alkaliphilum TaxID=3039283 RepID=UPI002A53894B|nr:hypothetical protein [Chitinispirillales bacterium ANBcel5]
MVFDIEQKKGNPLHLDGRVTVYGKIDIDPSDLMAMKHPIASMVHGGFLVAQGNFKEQNNLKDFLKSEMGVNLEEEGLGEGLAQLLEKMDGIESALDPQKLRDRLENMEELEDFIPTPAKIVPFHTLEEILSQAGDVFFVGTFKNIGNAVLSVNAFPIIYQAHYREQEMQKVRNEIESLITQIESSDTKVPQSAKNFKNSEDIEKELLKDYIPDMLYSKADEKSFAASKDAFKAFLRGYRFDEDVDAVLGTISAEKELTPKDYKLLELYAKKIDLVTREDFSKVDSVCREIDELKNNT